MRCSTVKYHFAMCATSTTDGVMEMWVIQYKYINKHREVEKLKKKKRIIIYKIK